MQSPPPPGFRARNGFDLIRLILAVLVVYSHARLVGGFGESWLQTATKNQIGIGILAVWGFFGLSGFLVSQSFLASGRWLTFIRHRLLRILPAFYIALILTAFVASPVIAWLRHADWHPLTAARFVMRNAGLRIQVSTIGSELANLPCDTSLNGSLWSLFSEACCYGLVLVLGLTGALSRKPYELLLVTGMMFVVNALLALPSPPYIPALPSFLVLSGDAPFVLAFLIGACFQTYREKIILGRSGAILFGLLSAAALKFGGWQVFGPVLFPALILHLGHSFSLRLKVDLSYGIYLFHFPGQQVLAAAGLIQLGLFGFFLCSLVIAVFLASVSWFAIEQPALRYK